jgi:tetratricopeptide (TPR) repeat protein
MAERFPNARLGEWGRGQFAAAVEHAWLVAMPMAVSANGEELAGKLLGRDASQHGLSLVKEFSPTEVPYLYQFLIHTTGSEEMKCRAKVCLARCLGDQYGLETGLGQYRILLDEGGRDDDAWLEAASQWERTGSHSRAIRAYRRVLDNTVSAKDAQQACDGLVHLLSAEARTKEVLAAWDVLTRRFPDAKCSEPETQNLLDARGGEQGGGPEPFANQLVQAKTETQSLQMCRRFHGLWAPQESREKWQAVVAETPPGSLADQLGRVFIARSLLDAGDPNAAEAAIQEMRESRNPVVRAQCSIVLAGIAEARGNAVEAVRQYAAAVRIERRTCLPSWCKEVIPREIPTGEPSSELQRWRLLLKGVNELSDGEFVSAVDTLEQAARDAPAASCSWERALSCMMMLAYLGSGDYPEADAWGHRSLAGLQKEHSDDIVVQEYLAIVQDIDMAIIALLAMVRTASGEAPAKCDIYEQAIRVCSAVAGLEMHGVKSMGIGAGIRQLHARTKRCHVARLLLAEYEHMRRRRTENKGETQLEPLLFAAQAVGEEPWERIQETLALQAPEQEAEELMHRFAQFAERVNRRDLMRDALDAILGRQEPPANPDILLSVAEMCLSTSEFQKAIDAYTTCIAHINDPSREQSIRLKIIKICADDLQDYAKAIQECEKFASKYPDSLQTSRIEFLIGRYAYMRKDYAGTVAQMDGVLKRYPGCPEAGQAMMLAGLSRMAEGNSTEAIARFTEIIRKYPEGEVPARSRFLIGYTYISEQNYAAALDAFQQLIEQFPQSHYVPQAQNLIDRLKRVSR